MVPLKFTVVAEIAALAVFTRPNAFIKDAILSVHLSVAFQH
jgi:hypothetical protein